MITVLLCLWCSAMAGYLLRRFPQKWIGGLISYIIWIMLFLLGVETGSNHQLVNSLDRLGIEAAIAAALTVAGSGIAALVFWHILTNKRNMKYGRENIKERQSIWMQMKDSLIIVVFFAIGCIAGYTVLLPSIPEKASFYVLCLLMGCVGFNIGQSAEIRQHIHQLDKRLMWLPFVTVIGTLSGIALTELLITRHSLYEWLAVGSGFGYYSLSGILVTEAKGAELGTLALMTNILREIITLIGAPLIYRWFGPLAPITAGGCTTEDTTLPVISRVCGAEFVPVSIFHGLTIDFAVPFLVSFFCAF